MVRVVFRGALLARSPLAAPECVPRLRAVTGGLRGFVEPRPPGCPPELVSGFPGRSPSPRSRPQAAPSSPPPGQGCGQDPLRLPRTLLRRSLPLPAGLGSARVSRAVPGTGPPAPPRAQPAPAGQSLPCLAVCISALRWPRVTPFFQGGATSRVPPRRGLVFPFPRIFSGSRNPGAKLGPSAGLGVS